MNGMRDTVDNSRAPHIIRRNNMTLKEYDELRKKYRRERRRMSQFIKELKSRGYDATLKSTLGEVPKEITQEDVDKLKSIQSFTDFLAASRPLAKHITAPAANPEATATTSEVTLMVYFSQFEDLELVSPTMSDIVGQFNDAMLSMFTREEFAQAIEEAENEEGIEFGRMERYNLIPAMKYFSSIKKHLEQFIKPAEGQTFLEAWGEFSQMYAELMDSFRYDWESYSGKLYDIAEYL